VNSHTKQRTNTFSINCWQLITEKVNSMAAYGKNSKKIWFLAVKN